LVLGSARVVKIGPNSKGSCLNIRSWGAMSEQLDLFAEPEKD